MRDNSIKIVATSDTHRSVAVNSMIPQGDVFIHAGDFMYTGYPDEWHSCVEWMRFVPCPYKYLVPGNHDFHLLHYPGPALGDLYDRGVNLLGLPGNDRFNSAVLPNGMKMLGIPFVVGLTHWAFNASEEHIEEYIRSNMDRVGDHFDVIVAHSPPKKIMDAVPSKLGLKYCGSSAIKKLLDGAYGKPPKLLICGHIHEGFGHQKYKETDVYNVSMCDHNYAHARKAVVIDIA